MAISDWFKDVPIVGQIIKDLADMIPALEDEAIVEIVGQPGASKKNLYYLALSTAFGLVRQYRSQTAGVFNTPPMGMIMLEYDAADNWVRCTLRYTTNTSGISVIGPGPPVAGSTLSIGDLEVYSGPRCDVVGAPYNFTGAVVVPASGFPRSSTDSPAPQLPFAGRTILTNCPEVRDPSPGVGPPGFGTIKTPNPKPPGDNRSRGGVVVKAVSGSSSSGDDCCARSLALIPLVFSSLSDPGSYGDEIFRDPVAGPTGG